MGLIGIDEVGRGCWAGPLLVVAARATAVLPVGLTDSKKLSRLARQRLAQELHTVCETGEGWVTPAEIDELGLTSAMKLAVARALKELGAQATDEIILDGNINYCDPHFSNVTCVIKADATVPTVSAASIIAKVLRDTYMFEQAKRMPEYGFEQHVGYGTTLHSAALQNYGVSELHRLSYKPIKQYI